MTLFRARRLEGRIVENVVRQISMNLDIKINRFEVRWLSLSRKKVRFWSIHLLVVRCQGTRTRNFTSKGDILARMDNNPGTKYKSRIHFLCKQPSDQSSCSLGFFDIYHLFHIHALMITVIDKVSLPFTVNKHVCSNKLGNQNIPT